MADVLDCPVARVQVANGAALRAAHGYALKAIGEASWDEVLAGYSDAHGSIAPESEANRIYDRIVGTYAARERETLSNFSLRPHLSYAEA